MQQLVPLLRRSLSLSGCAGREEFIAVLLVTWAVDLVLWFAIGADHIPVPRFPGRFVMLLGGEGAFAVLLTLAIHYPLIATAVRRLHDWDVSGWWLLFYSLLFMLPSDDFIAAVIGILIAVPAATPNRYDPDRQAPLPSSAAG